MATYMDGMDGGKHNSDNIEATFHTSSMDQVYVEYGQEYNGRPIREGQCPHCASDNWETLDQG